MSRSDRDGPRHLLVIGAQRSGTTYLHRLLEAHPQIAMNRPARPEPKVFCSDEATDRGMEWYRHTWFGHATDELLLGDKSTSYLEDPLAPARAARMLGEPVVLVQLRDPLERAVSNWAFSTDNGYEDRPLEEALAASLADARHDWDAAATSVSPRAYLQRGRYVEYLAPWLERFPRLRIGLLEDLVRDPGELPRLYADLGVDPGFRPADDRVGTPVNASSERAEVSGRELRSGIRSYFADSDRALADLLGRPLPWPTAENEETP